MNYKAHILAFKSARDAWLEILNKTPDSIEAAQQILSCNNKLELLNTMRYADGDFSEID